MTGELIIRAESSKCVSVHTALKEVDFFDRANLLRNFAKALDMDVEDIAIATTLFPYIDHISTTNDIEPEEKREPECECDCKKQDGENEVEEDLGNGHTITIKVT